MSRLVILLVVAVAIAGSVLTIFVTQMFVPSLQFSRICRVDNDAVLTKTNVGVKAAALLRDLHTKIQSQVNVEKDQIVAGNLALPGNQKDDTEDTQAQRKDLMRRWDELQKEANTQSEKLNTLRNTIVSRLADLDAIIISESAGALNCSVVLSRDAAKSGTRVTDITDFVIVRMNERYSNINIENDLLPKLAHETGGP